MLALSPWIHGLLPRQLYISVAVTPAPARVPTQRPLVSLHRLRLGRELFTLPTYFNITLTAHKYSVYVTLSHSLPVNAILSLEDAIRFSNVPAYEYIDVNLIGQGFQTGKI